MVYIYNLKYFNIRNKMSWKEKKEIMEDENQSKIETKNFETHNP